MQTWMPDRRALLERLAIVVGLMLVPALHGCGSNDATIEKKAAALMRANLPSEAVHLVNSQFEQHPSSPRLAALAGRVRLWQRDWAGSEAAYATACTIDTGYIAVRVKDHVEQAAAWLATGETEPAMRAFDLAVKIRPSIAPAIGAALARAAKGSDADRLASARQLADRYGAGAEASFDSAFVGSRLTQDVAVGADRGWVPTTFLLAPGDTVWLEATGTVRAEAAHEGWVSDPHGPAGWPSGAVAWQEERGDLLDPGAPRMALLARVGAARGVPTGERIALQGLGPGRLFLGVNEAPARARMASGSFHVRVTAPARCIRPGEDDTRRLSEAKP